MRLRELNSRPRENENRTLQRPVSLTETQNEKRAKGRDDVGDVDREDVGSGLTMRTMLPTAFPLEYA